MTEVAFIGLGAMGSRMAMNLHRAGFALRVWNRDAAKARRLAEAGARLAASPSDAATGASFVLSIVADDLATREVMLGADGILARIEPGTIVIDASTNTPGMAREAAARGVHYLDAPVLGSLPQAEAGELVFLVGGDQAAFERSKPLLGAMSRTCHYLGDSGAGATVKLINNMVSGSLTAVLAEAAQVAEAARLDPAATVAALSDGAASSRILRSKLPAMFQRDFTPQFQLALMEKDIRYFLQLAADLDRPAPLASLIRSQYQAARRADLGKLDSCAIFLEDHKAEIEQAVYFKVADLMNADVDLIFYDTTSLHFEVDDEYEVPQARRKKPDRIYPPLHKRGYSKNGRRAALRRRRRSAAGPRSSALTFSTVVTSVVLPGKTHERTGNPSRVTASPTTIWGASSRCCTAASSAAAVPTSQPACGASRSALLAPPSYRV